MELSSILDPGRPPKMDKAVMLSDALRMVTQLRGEAQKLKESKENLQEKINEMKVRLGFVVSVFCLFSLEGIWKMHLLFGIILYLSAAKYA
jgi:accessory gene regulator protein AgrB